MSQELGGDRVPLSSLYNIPSEYLLSEATKRYYGSMTPDLEVLRALRHIDFEVSFTEPKECSPLDNPINTHLYKPKYVDAQCYVSNPEVLAHTLRSVAVLAHHVSNTTLTASVRKLGHQYINYCSSWEIADRVLFCWKDSFLKFLRVHWLLTNGVDTQQTHRLVCELENRLASPNPAVLNEIDMACRARGISLDTFEETFAIRHQNTSVSWITAANLLIGDKPITVVQFPWGISLAHEMLSVLLTQHQRITRIGVVGGVGYLRDDGMALDDVFLATALMRSESQKFDNLIFDTPDNAYFRKPHSRGCIKTVIPTIGVLSNTADLKNRQHEIAAIDMEFAGFVDLVHHRDFAAAHYIMDLPFKGLSLGDTYYNRSYLETFFKTFNRGKYYCFERMLSFMQM